MKIAIKAPVIVTSFFLFITLALIFGVSKIVLKTVQETVIDQVNEQLIDLRRVILKKKLLDHPEKMAEAFAHLQNQHQYLITAYILINGEIAFSTDPEQLYQNIFAMKQFRDILPKQLLLKEQREIVYSGNHLIYYIPLIKEKKIILMAYYSLEPVMFFATHLRTNLMIYMGVVLLLLLSLLYVVARTLILKPIQKLEEKTRAVSEGNFHYETTPPRNDELGMVNQVFDQMVQNISDMLTEKDTLLRILSHDLTNQIGSSKYLLKKVMSQLDELRPETLQRYLESVCEALDQSFELISFTRNLIAIETGKLTLKPELYTLEPLIETILPGFIQQGREKDISIRFFVKEPYIKGLIEPVIFKHTIIGNLLSNAIKFSYRQEEVRISLRKMGETQVLISIQNRGPHILPSKLNSIFQLTDQTSTLGTVGEKGSGLGLPLVYKFVTLLGGKIEASSIPIVTVEAGKEIPADNEFILILPAEIKSNIGADIDEKKNGSG